MTRDKVIKLLKSIKDTISRIESGNLPHQKTFAINTLGGIIQQLEASQYENEYTTKDLCEFAEWCSHNFWHFVTQENVWINIDKTEYKTTSQLKIDWEIETGRKQSEKLTKNEYLKQVEESKKNIPPEGSSYDLQKHGSFTGRREK